ncbi:MAG: type II toxin-antitoxin system mRNA interferase toxin, RelE/StbE family [Candidatus Omnitrophica bacterium CG10_big_fil_rev_8_21_14_0_10_43_8]|nr:MAG: type II toxin-antitoxin system mRNA interferase toxin, RelE/StbE family [Candidatus Omnitrophica bacterium CG10_big_fil_rev_8_21_14_0_10_43_8]
MYRLKIIPQAQKDLNQLQDKTFHSVKNAILELSANPRPYGVTKLTNENGYRIRIGDYRVLYRIDDKLKEVFIYRINHRNEAYR